MWDFFTQILYFVVECISLLLKLSRQTGRLIYTGVVICTQDLYGQTQCA